MKTSTARWQRQIRTPASQRGIVAVVVTVGMLALLAVTGLALDSGHMLVNKTNLQNATDAAALAAGRTLQQQNGDRTAAIAAANTVFNANLTGELQSISPTITVTFSETLQPGSFQNTVTDPNYVKVETSVVALNSYLIQLVGVNSKNVSTASVAGYAQGANICNLIPVMVCSRPNPTDSDGNDLPGYFHGYKTFDPDNYNAATDVTTLKVGSGEGPDTEVGTGSFHLLDLPGLNGADDIRYAFAGNPSCAAINTPLQIRIAPGNRVGPTVQGINTRFGDYAGPIKGDRSIYPPDLANDNASSPICEDGSPTACNDPVTYHNYYQQAQVSSQYNSQQFKRRIVGVPIANCSVAGTGSNTPAQMQTPLGIGCFLLTETASQTGGTKKASGSFKGVFIEECSPPSLGITTSSGVDVIVLYKNPDRGDA